MLLMRKSYVTHHGTLYFQTTEGIGMIQFKAFHTKINLTTQVG